MCPRGVAVDPEAAAPIARCLFVVPWLSHVVARVLRPFWEARGSRPASLSPDVRPETQRPIRGCFFGRLCLQRAPSEFLSLSAVWRRVFVATGGIPVF